MGRLAGVSGKDAVKRFVQLGYRVIHQRGSHVRLEPSDTARRAITVPMHRELKFGLLRQLIKDAGLSVDEFLKL